MVDEVKSLERRLEEANEIIIQCNERLFAAQQQHIEDMRDFAHQSMKLSTDLINMQLGTIQAPAVEVTGDEEPDEVDPAMSGGAMG